MKLKLVNLADVQHCHKYLIKVNDSFSYCMAAYDGGSRGHNRELVFLEHGHLVNGKNVKEIYEILDDQS